MRKLKNILIGILSFMVITPIVYIILELSCHISIATLDFFIKSHKIVSTIFSIIIGLLLSIVSYTTFRGGK